MMIYKNNGKGGFAVGSNRFSREDLAAGGIAALALVLMSLIGLAKPKKERKKSAVARILSAPFLFRLAKAGVSRINLDSLVKKAKNGEVVSTFFTDDIIHDDDGSVEDTYAEGFAENIDENADGVEVIPSTPIASEEEVYEHI
jgi:hypothetical protein